jgi:hypothetical protein
MKIPDLSRWRLALLFRGSETPALHQRRSGGCLETREAGKKACADGEWCVGLAGERMRKDMLTTTKLHSPRRFHSVMYSDDGLRGQCCGHQRARAATYICALRESWIAVLSMLDMN